MPSINIMKELPFHRIDEKNMSDPSISSAIIFFLVHHHVRPVFFFFNFLFFLEPTNLFSLSSSSPPWHVQLTASRIIFPDTIICLLRRLSVPHHSQHKE